MSLMTILPWLAFAVSIALLSVSPRREGADALGLPPSWRDVFTPMILLLIGAAVAAGLGVGLAGALEENRWALFGLAVGFAFPVGLALLEQRQTDPTLGRMVPVGFAVALVGWMQTPGLPDLARTHVGLLVGVSVAALLLRSGSGSVRPTWPIGLAASLAVIVPAGLLGRMALGEKAGETGVVFGLAALVAAVLGWAIARGSGQDSSSKAESGDLGKAIAAAIIVLAGWLLGKNVFHIPEMGWVVTAAVVSAMAVGWLLPDGKPQSAFSLLLCATLWLGIATFGFAQFKGYGMAVAMLPAGLLLLMGGQRAALASLSPLVALVFYRLFREQYTDASRALDIGQHYAIIGLMIGLLLVMGCIEWLGSRNRSDGVFGTIGAALAGALCLYLLVGSVVLLGAKGAVGLLLGLGLAPLVSAMSGRNGLVASVWSVGLMGFLIGIYGPLAGKIDLNREAKIGFVVWFVAVALVLAVAVRILSGRPREVKA